MKAFPPDLPLSSAQPPTRRRSRILFTLVAVLTAVGLVPLGIVSLKLIDYNREALTTEKQGFQLLLASSIARQVDTHVDGLRSQFERVAQTLGPTLGRVDPVQAEEARGLLDDLVDERMLCIRYTGLRGRISTHACSELGPASLEDLFAQGFNRAAESLAGSSGGKPGSVWTSDPILLPGKRPRAALLLSTPVVTRGGFRGVLSAVVDIQSAWNAVTADGSNGHTMFAVDSTGRIFASNDPEGRRPGSRTDSELIAHLQAADSRYPVTMPFRESSQDYLGSYLRTREGWGVLVQIEKERIFAPVEDMIQTTRSWGLAALALSILAAVVLAGTLSNPIRRLAAVSREFASGNLAARVRVRSNNEIGELAETFNLMAAEIEEDIRRLKKAAEENRDLFLDTIAALTAAIDAKDPYTRGHSERVNEYAVKIARAMDLPEDQIWEIHVASRLHDVGKIAIDDAVLRKPGRLSPEEMEHMKTHPARGAAIMESIRQMKNILPGLRSHHERWEGGGYPDGLKGEEIPLMARIIAVADTLDATTTERPYQRAMTFDQARNRINELRGVALDMRVVEAFNRAYEAGEFVPPKRDEVAASA